MLIVGARGQAVEIWQCLDVVEREQAVFFDDVTPNTPSHILGGHTVLRTVEEARTHLRDTDPQFVLGFGGPLRKQLAAKFRAWGGQLTSVIADTAVVGPHVSHLGEGINIMQYCFVAPLTHLGEGVLVNAGAAIHHDVEVGDYCEISPGARLLGRCKIGAGSRVGAMAVVLPDIIIGEGAIIGAGAVVTKNVQPGFTVAGVPARPLHHSA